MTQRHGLERVMRFARREVDAGRLALHRAQTDLADNRDALEDLERTEAHELGGALAREPEGPNLARFLESCRTRRSAMQGAIADLEAEHESTLEALRESMRGLNRLKILAARRERRMQLEAERRERKTLDEVAAQCHLRRRSTHERESSR